MSSGCDLPQFPANSTPAYIQLKACYSNYSIVDRPWRAYNNVISVRHRCGGYIVLCFNLDRAPAARSSAGTA